MAYWLESPAAPSPALRRRLAETKFSQIKQTVLAADRHRPAAFSQRSSSRVRSDDHRLRWITVVSCAI